MRNSIPATPPEKPLQILELHVSHLSLEEGNERDFSAIPRLGFSGVYWRNVEY